MNDIGTLSAYSAYAGKSLSAYSSKPVTPVEKNKESSSAENLPKPTYPADIKDEAIISDEAQKLLAKEQGNQQDETSKTDKSTSVGAEKELTPEQQQVVAKLKARDREVKAHEQAHIAAAAGINASAPTYDYQVGPDGKQYAIGGEVSISFTESKDPESNIANAEAMKAAALAPADPSGQDLSVARSADEIIAKAKQDLAEQNSKASKGGTPEGNSTEETSGNIANAPKDPKAETILQNT